MNQPAAQPVSHRLRNKVVGLSAAILTLLALLYLASPWLIPQEWVATALSRRLEAVMNRRTHIDTIEFSFRRGLVIEGLRLARRPGFGTGALLTAEQVVVPLSSFKPARPLILLGFLTGLVSGPFDQIRIRYPQSWIVADDHGVLNIADLNDRGGAKLPARGFDIAHLTIHFIDLRRGPFGDLESVPQKIVLPALKCTLTPATGSVGWRSGTAAEQSPAQIELTGEITSPRLTSDVTLGGGGSIQWRDLNLNQIPRFLIPLPNVQSLEGASDGSLEVQVSEDLEVTFSADFEVHEARIQLTGERSCPLIDGTHVSLSGHWDPHSRYVEISEFTLHVPAVMRINRRSKTQPAIVIDPKAERQVAIALAGKVESLDLARNQVASLVGWDLAGLQAVGSGTFEFDYSRTRDERKYELELDLTAAQIESERTVRLPRGESKVLRVSLVRGTDAGWRLLELEARVADSALTFAGDWPLIVRADNLTSRLERWIDQGRGRLDFETSDAAALLDRIPLLAGLWPAAQIHGPLAMHHEISPATDGAWIAGQWRFGPESTFDLGQVARKTRGEKLRLNYAAVVHSAQLGKIDKFTLDLEYGKTHVSTIGDETTLTMSTQVPQSRWDREKLGRGALQVSAHAAIQINDVEDGLTLFPSLGARLRQVFSPQAGINGSCRVTVNLNAAIVHRKPVVRVHASLDADELDVYLGDVFHSPRHSRCNIDLDYAFDGRARRQSQMLRLDAALAGGRLDVLAEWSRRSDGPAEIDETAPQNWTGPDAAVGIEFEDLPRFLSHWPALEEQLSPYKIAGAGNLAVRASGWPGRTAFEGEADFTDVHIESRSGDWHKPRRMPLTLSWSGRLRGRSATAASEDFVVNRAVGALGSSSFNVRNLTIGIVDADDHIAAGSHAPDDAGKQMKRLQRLELAAAIDASFDDPWPATALHDPLENWAQSHGARGNIVADVSLRYDGAAWRLEGLASADSLSLSGRAGPAGPLWFKPAGLKTELEFTSSLIPTQSTDRGYEVNLAECELRLGRLSGSATGSFTWSPASAVLAGPQTADVVATIDLPDLAAVESVWPAWAEADLNGAARAVCALALHDHRWRVDSALLELQDLQLFGGHAKTIADGVMRYDQGFWQSDSLSVELGCTRALLSGEGCLTDPDIPFRLSARLGEVDRDHAAAELSAISADALAVLSLATGHEFDLARLEEILLSDAVAGNVHAEVAVGAAAFRWQDGSTPVPHQVDELVSTFNWRMGEVEGHIRGAYEGGLLYAEITGPTDRYRIQYTISEALASHDLLRRLRFQFPGLEASGTIDYSHVPGAPPKDWAATGEQPRAFGELIVRGGTLRGKAASEWVAGLFPRLNLAAFNFNLMHDWYTAYADGRVEHQAVFQGRYYHLYATGWENPDGKVEYEIGVDLLGGLDSPYWATSGSGRIPLFTSTTHLGPDGQVLEETVNYVPLEFVKAILWGTNPIHTAYLALRKRIEGK